MNSRQVSALYTLRSYGFGRIAEPITLMWGHPELDDYLSKLIVSDRDDREGFPEPVMDALLQLANLHNGIHDLRIVKQIAKW